MTDEFDDEGAWPTDDEAEFEDVTLDLNPAKLFGKQQKSGNLSFDFLQSLADGLNPDRKVEKSIWEPLPGPQTMAFYSEADEMFYGGSAGGGKSDLMLGLSLSELSPHKKAIIFRKSYGELKDIRVRGLEILSGTGAKFKAGTAMRFDNLPYDKSLELGSVGSWGQAQKYKGRPHDLKLFDELPDISEIVYTFLIAWNRSAIPGMRTRIVAAGNPPTTTEGQWVVRRWRAWLDPSHPNPAKHGELRWFATLDGDDTELDEHTYPEGSQGKPFQFLNKKGIVENIAPASRTFIAARVTDNKYLMATDYMTRLQNLAEPFRSQLLLGDFGLSMKADPYQVIPTEWARLSQERYKKAREDGTLKRYEQANTAFGLDVSEAGGDTTQLAKLTAHIIQWIKAIEIDVVAESLNAEEKGLKFDKSDPMLLPKKQADLIEVYMGKSKGSVIGLDAIGVGIGVGSHLRLKRMTVMPIKGQRGIDEYDETGQFQFINLRAYLWWRLREAMNPARELPLMIPDDPKLFAQLTAPKFMRTSNDRIQIESKKTIKERLGYSPDMAEAVMYALYALRKNGVALRVV